MGWKTKTKISLHHNSPFVHKAGARAIVAIAATAVAAATRQNIALWLVPMYR